MENYFNELRNACFVCGGESALLFNYMLDNEELRAKDVKLCEHADALFGGKHYVFRVQFPSNERLFGVSVSVPLDANSGRKYGDKDPPTYEMALVGTNEDLTYVDELGYSDVCRFQKMSEVVEEVLRLVDMC